MSDYNRNNPKNPFERVMDYVQNTRDDTQEYDQEDIQRNKIVTAVSYIPILFFLPLVVCPQSRFGRFHANQSLVLFIVSALVSAALSVLSMIFSLGLAPLALVFRIISEIWGLAILLMVVLGVINTVNGKARELPVIGKWRILK